MGTRYIHLVRHGQYQLDKEHGSYGSLTSLGRYQARKVAKRLNDHKVSQVHVSTMIRAQETGEIIIDRLKSSKSRNCRLLVEGIPEFPEALIRKKGIKKTNLKKAKSRMNKAFRKYFTPFKGKGERHEVLVCHGNIIRYLVAKALKVETAKWINFDIYQCSLSTVCIDDKGKLRLEVFGEIGHIPVEKRTFI